jgi:hypothetical protein
MAGPVMDMFPNDSNSWMSCGLVCAGSISFFYWLV